MAADSKFQASPDQPSNQNLPVTHIKGKKVRHKIEAERKGVILCVALLKNFTIFNSSRCSVHYHGFLKHP